jgi:foldase protein PrsA
MRRLRLLIPLAVGLAALALVVAGCGGGKASVPADSVAVVGKQKVTKAELDAYLKRRQAYDKLQKQTFPKEGSPAFIELEAQIVQGLVQRVEIQQKATSIGISVTPAEIDSRVQQVKKQYFGGNEQKLEKALAQQGYDVAGLRDDLQAQILGEKLFKKVTANVKVADPEVAQYYAAHKDLYGQPESRTVRHILVKQRALAFSIYHQLKKGADFTALAKKYSQDLASKASGGKLTISKGQTVPQFDRVAFSLDTKQISPPVQTQFGWHVIQALTPVKPATTMPLAQVKGQIKSQLLQTKQNKAVADWVNALKKEFADKVVYASTFAPPATTTTSTASATTTTG